MNRLGLIPLAVTHRLYIDGAWKVVDERTWWVASETGDIWHTGVDSSTCVLTITPNEFVPPRHLR